MSVLRSHKRREGSGGGGEGDDDKEMGGGSHERTGRRELHDRREGRLRRPQSVAGSWEEYLRIIKGSNL